MRCWEHAPKRDTYRLEGGHTHHTLLACANRAWRTTSEFRSSWIPLSTITPPLLRPRHILCPVASPPRIPFPLSPLPLSELQCKSFPFEKNKKKKKTVFRSNSLSIIALFERIKAIQLLFSSSRYIYEWISPLSLALYPSRRSFSHRRKGQRCVPCFALATSRFERFSGLDEGIFVSFKIRKLSIERERYSSEVIFGKICFKYEWIISFVLFTIYG